MLYNFQGFTEKASLALNHAIESAMADAEKGGFGPVPAHLRDSHYSGNERLGVKTGTEYKYPHDYPGHWVQQQYLPDDLVGTRYYEYGPNKLEQSAKQYWDQIKKK